VFLTSKELDTLIKATIAAGGNYPYVHEFLDKKKRAPA
jgi:hypothetical protein